MECIFFSRDFFTCFFSLPGRDDNGLTSFPVRFDHDDMGYYHAASPFGDVAFLASGPPFKKVDY